MAKKHDHQNLEVDLGPPQRRSLLGLSSELPDIVPSQGITIAQMRQSNDIINVIIRGILSFTNGISTAWYASVSGMPIQSPLYHNKPA